MKNESVTRSVARYAGVGLLVLATLFLAQFALQAAFNDPLQAVLTVLATVAFGVAAYRLHRHQRLAGLLFLLTLPLFVFSVIGSLVYSDESWIYAQVSAIPPLVAAGFWVARRPRSALPPT